MKKTKTTEETIENKVEKISELHLAKLQELTQKQEVVDKEAAQIHQREFELKQAKNVLDGSNSEVLFERQKLINEFTQTYGRVNINPMTGEFQNME
ncbi:hypothetical protein ACKUSY_05675 [Myroides odoratus]